jgi:hypothetical protein
MMKGNNSKGGLQTQRPKQSPKKKYKRCRKSMPIIEINSYILMSLAEREIPCRQK